MGKNRRIGHEKVLMRGWIDVDVLYAPYFTEGEKLPPKTFSKMAAVEQRWAMMVGLVPVLNKI